jgi:hypothetical protein
LNPQLDPFEEKRPSSSEEQGQIGLGLGQPELDGEAGRGSLEGGAGLPAGPHLPPPVLQAQPRRPRIFM